MDEYNLLINTHINRTIPMVTRIAITGVLILPHQPRRTRRRKRRPQWTQTCRLRSLTVPHRRHLMYRWVSHCTQKTFFLGFSEPHFAHLIVALITPSLSIYHGSRPTPSTPLVKYHSYADLLQRMTSYHGRGAFGNISEVVMWGCFRKVTNCNCAQHLQLRILTQYVQKT